MELIRVHSSAPSENSLSPTISLSLRVIEAESPAEFVMTSVAGKLVSLSFTHQNPSMTPKGTSSPFSSIFVILCRKLTGCKACHHLEEPGLTRTPAFPVTKFEGHSTNSQVPSYREKPSFPVIEFQAAVEVSMSPAAWQVGQESTTIRIVSLPSLNPPWQAPWNWDCSHEHRTRTHRPQLAPFSYMSLFEFPDLVKAAKWVHPSRPEFFKFAQFMSQFPPVGSAW